jgi:hypothetical protein
MRMMGTLWKLRDFPNTFQKVSRTGTSQDHSGDTLELLRVLEEFPRRFQEISQNLSGVFPGKFSRHFKESQTSGECFRTLLETS